MKEQINEIKQLEISLNQFQKKIKKIETKDNIFKILKIQNMELKHSVMLAYLLDSKENHGLENKMMKEFLKEWSKMYSNKEFTFPKDYEVFLEYQNIDLLIKSDQEQKLICIENKIWTSEHDNQLSKYYQLLEEKYPTYEKLLCYLTPYGENPKKEEDALHWYVISYKMILNALEKLNLKKVDERTKLLIGDYKEMVRSDILMENEKLKEYCMEFYLKHKNALDLILDYVDVCYYSRNLMLNYVKNEKEFFLDEENSTNRFIKFRTKTLLENFPSKSCYYEIYLNKSYISVALIFLYPDNMRKEFYEKANKYVKERYEKPLASYKEKSYFISKSLGWFDTTGFTLDEKTDQEYVNKEMDQMKKKKIK